MNGHHQQHCSRVRHRRRIHHDHNHHDHPCSALCRILPDHPDMSHTDRDYVCHRTVYHHNRVCHHTDLYRHHNRDPGRIHHHRVYHHIRHVYRHIHHDDHHNHHDGHQSHPPVYHHNRLGHIHHDRHNHGHRVYHHIYRFCRHRRLHHDPYANYQNFQIVRNPGHDFLFDHLVSDKFRF